MDKIIDDLRTELASHRRLADRACSSLTFAQQRGGSSARQIEDLKTVKWEAITNAEIIASAIRDLGTVK